MPSSLLDVVSAGTIWNCYSQLANTKEGFVNLLNIEWKDAKSPAPGNWRLQTSCYINKVTHFSHGLSHFSLGFLLRATESISIDTAVVRNNA